MARVALQLCHRVVLQVDLHADSALALEPVDRGVEALPVQTVGHSYYLLLGQFGSVSLVNVVKQDGQNTNDKSESQELKVAHHEEKQHQRVHASGIRHVTAVVGVAEEQDIAVNKPAGHC